MANVDDIIEYIKTIRRGFDKNLFQSKIDELANAVDTTGLVYEDFHTLFTVWLQSSLPIPKWVNMGSCLVPPDKVEEKTVQYALRWILMNLHDQKKSTRVQFLLDWLTVAMDCESIDMTALDSGYDIFYNLLTFESLTVHAAKLVYTLTKPKDVTRTKAIQLLKYVSIREANKRLCKQLQVILALFKLYRPDFVLENIPAIPIYTAFKKLDQKQIYTRFKNLQERRNMPCRQYFVGTNSTNFEKGRNKKLERLVPNLQFITLRNKEDIDEITFNFNDSSDAAALLQASALGRLSRPPRLRALLCHGMGHTLLAVHPHAHHVFLSYDLRAVLCGCFMEPTPYSYLEKANLLQKLAEFQRTLLQGVPIVTCFLAHYLPCWNENDYFPEILELCEWMSASRPEDVTLVWEALGAACIRARPLEQCSILRTLSHMYTNLVYASTRSLQHFLPQGAPSPANYELVIPALAQAISTLCYKLLQADPGELRVLYMCVWSALHCARGERASGAPLGALPSRLTLALPLLSVSPVLIDNMAKLLVLYRKIVKKTEAENSHVELINKYLHDLLNCVYSDEAFSGRERGIVFQTVHPMFVESLKTVMPDFDARLSLKNHIAFASLTYANPLYVNGKDADNKILFHGVIKSEYPNLGLLMKKTLPELDITDCDE